VDIGVSPWPSDHRAVLATLEITPAPAPVLVTAWPARVEQGGELRVRLRGLERGRVVLAPAHAPASALAAAREASSGDMALPTKDLAPGAHEVTLLDLSGRSVSTAGFWLAGPEARPSVTLERDRLKAGEGIAVRWTEAPAFRWDWVGVYAEGVEPEADGQPLLWRHTRATVAGATRLDATAEGEGWPLAPGAYRVCLFEDDAYQPLACARLSVER
jgi:hypothetical protein